LKNIKVILAPLDFRKPQKVPDHEKLPPWTAALYERIRAELLKTPAVPD
jgi:hypothetical protein